MKDAENIPPFDHSSDRLKKIKDKKIKKDKSKIDGETDVNPPSICHPVYPPDLSEEDRIQLEEITKEVNSKIDEVIRKEIEDKAKKGVDILQLKKIATEYCNTFMIIGYTLEGEPFVIYNAKTAQDNNALAEHLRLTFINIYKPPLF